MSVCGADAAKRLKGRVRGLRDRVEVLGRLSRDWTDLFGGGFLLPPAEERAVDRVVGERDERPRALRHALHLVHSLGNL